MVLCSPLEILKTAFFLLSQSFFIRSMVRGNATTNLRARLSKVSIPFSSGQWFCGKKNLDKWNQSVVGLNPFFIRSMVLCCCHLKYLSTELRLVSIPFSSGQWFCADTQRKNQAGIITSQSLFHQVNGSVLYLACMPVRLRSMRLNPFFIRSMVLCLSNVTYHFCYHRVSIPFSSGQWFCVSRILDITYLLVVESQSLFHQVNGSVIEQWKEGDRGFFASQSLFHQVNGSVFGWLHFLRFLSLPSQSLFHQVNGSVWSYWTPTLQVAYESQSLFHQVNGSVQRRSGRVLAPLYRVSIRF